MADGKKADKKPAGKKSANKPAQEEGRKVNPWIPIAVVVVIVALVAIMAAMSGNNSSTTVVDQAASGTTQSGDTSGASTVDVSWLTLETTPNEVVQTGGIPAKMLQQLISITDADMGKPFKDLGGEETLAKVVNVVSQFGGGGGGAMGGSTSGAPSGMGGTTTTP